MKHQEVLTSRRLLLQSGVLGAALLGLRASASGIPIPVLKDPRKVLTMDLAHERAGGLAPQYLVLSCSDSGDPLNANTPGMYDDSNMLHPASSNVAPATFMLGTATTKAAMPWAKLDATALSRTAFFHHGTYTFGHGDLNHVQGLQGEVSAQEMFFSAFSKRLQPLLNTIQAQPIVLSNSGTSEQVRFGGQQQPMLSPTAMRDLLATPSALQSLSKLQSQRDYDLDALNKLVRAEGTPAQQTLVDYWAQSQAQARAMSQTILHNLSGINDDGIDSQLAAAAVLVQLKLTPVMVVHMSFGGDNHTDGGLNNEANALVSSLQSLSKFQSLLASAQISNQVTFATLNTFGRDNSAPGLNGRGHNGDHSCNIIMGTNVRAGIIGGATLYAAGNRAQAMTIDSTTGTGSVSGGDISQSKTLASFGKTVGMALGVSDADINTDILEGAAVKAAVNV